MVQDYTTIDNKDGALSEGSRRLSDDDTESGCNSTVAARSFIVNSGHSYSAAVVTLAMVVVIIVISLLSSNNGISND